MHTNTGEI